jgi:ABC-type taurine transport system substrate-binding protein
MDTEIPRTPSAQARPFLDNPWHVTVAEAKALVRLPDLGRRDLAKELGISFFTLQDQISSAFLRMKVHRAEAACVYFDRWWQRWQVLNPQSAQEARDLLDL